MNVVASCHKVMSTLDMGNKTFKAFVFRKWNSKKYLPDNNELLLVRFRRKLFLSNITMADTFTI